MLKGDLASMIIKKRFDRILAEISQLHFVELTTGKRSLNVDLDHTMDIYDDMRT